MNAGQSNRKYTRLLREAETASYGIEYGAAETAWYSTAGCSAGLVGVCHTTGRRRHRFPCRIAHLALLPAGLEAVSVGFEANNSFMQPCSGSEARCCSWLTSQSI